MKKGSKLKKGFSKVSLMLCSLLAGAMMLTACGASASTSNSVKVKDSTVAGIVQSVNGNTITLKSAGQRGPGGPNGGMFMPEDRREDSMPNENRKDGNAFGKETENNDLQKGEGKKAPSGDKNVKEENKGNESKEDFKDNKKKDFSERGSISERDELTFEITVKNTSVIKDEEGNKVELKDIKEGSFIEFTTDKKGDITKVVTKKNAQDLDGISQAAPQGRPNSDGDALQKGDTETQNKGEKQFNGYEGRQPERDMGSMTEKEKKF